MPQAFNRSQHLGPHARGAEPADDLAVLRDAQLLEDKISCMVMTSPSMPVISEIAVTLRVPSLNRVCWTTTSWMAAAICCRMARSSGIRRPHRDHRFNARQRVARAVCVNDRQRSVMARVHRLEHVERFLATDLADDDDAIGTQGVDDQLPLRTAPLPSTFGGRVSSRATCS